MAVSLEERVERLTATVLSQGARLSLLDVAVRCVIVTHPRPERLRAAFEPAGIGLLDRALNSRLSEEALEDAQNLFQDSLKLIDKAPSDR